MDWLKRSTDSHGITTVFPPEPTYEKKPRCSQCGGLTQFLHFFVDILQLLQDDDIVPSFCSTVCAKEFVKIRKVENVRRTED